MKTTPILMLLVAAALTSGRAQAQWKTPWAYEGPRGAYHWSELDPDYALCNRGLEQSPINIQGAAHAPLPAIRFEYKSGPLKYLINNGYTIRVNYHDAPGSGNFLVVDNERYQLQQFHFHRPSEEFVNGKPYDMVVHFMHKSDAGKLVGVAIFLKAGSANATIQRLWQHMPATAGAEHEVPGVEINPADLLPANHAYYVYTGSITAPPCTEGVMWYVLKTPMTISERQIDAFAALYPHDVRPLQPLNSRVIKETP